MDQTSLSFVKLVVEQRDVGHDGELVGALRIDNVGHVEERRDSQELLGRGEGKVTVISRVSRREETKVDQVRPELVDDGTEGPAVPPAAGHVQYVEAGVAGEDGPAPGQETSGSHHTSRPAHH